MWYHAERTACRESRNLQCRAEPVNLKNRERKCERWRLSRKQVWHAVMCGASTTRGESSFWRASPENVLASPSYEL